MSKHYLPYCEFYITNVCNLNCDDCNRFNNYAFSGHYSWTTSQSMYKQWAEILDIDMIGIVGGEPLLNPEFDLWIKGIRDLWPNSRIKIISNGTQLHRCPDLYNIMRGSIGNIELDINIHDPDRYDEMISWVKDFLCKPYKSYEDHVWAESYKRVRDPGWPDCESIEAFYNLPLSIQIECKSHGCEPYVSDASQYHKSFVDSNQVTVKIIRAWTFYQSAVKFDGQKLSLHSSDPVKAMSACAFKVCHHFIGGKLYKCGPVGILPEFIKQFPVDISPEDHKLLNSYEPADANWDDTTIQTFVRNLRDAQPIPQCKFCPENTSNYRSIKSSHKKILIRKKISCL